LKQRIITALIIAPLAIMGIFFLPLKFFMFFSAAIFLQASKEWSGFVSKEKPASLLYLFALLLGGTILIVPSEELWINDAVNPLLFHCLSAAVAWWCLSLLMVITYPKTAVVWKNKKIIKGISGLLTLIPFFWGMVVLRSVNIYSDFYYGGGLLFFVFVLVWAADTGAYFCGKSFGRHKLAPNVSPGKTVEGFIGGLLSAMLVAFLVASFFTLPSEKVYLFYMAALLTTLASALGDLNESIFKREAGLKDSGNLLPGHGGILDRIDSLTAAVPVFAIIYLLWLN